MKEDDATKPFVRFMETLEPWLSEVVLIGGWAHRLYRLDPRAHELSYPPLTTLDGDVPFLRRLAENMEVSANGF